MSVSNISFLLSNNKSILYNIICKLTSPQNLQVKMTSQMPSNLGYSISTSFFPPYIHTECPPAPLHGSHWSRAAGWWQWQEERLQQKASSRCTESFTVAPQRRRKTKVCSLTTECPWDYWGWGENQKGGGHRGRGRSSISQFTSGTELMVISWGERGETEPPEKCVREKNTSERRRRDEGWGSRGGGDGGYSHTICVTSLALFLSLLKAREHLRGSPLSTKPRKENSQMYFLLTQRL